MNSLVLLYSAIIIPDKNETVRQIKSELSINDLNLNDYYVNKVFIAAGSAGSAEKLVSGSSGSCGILKVPFMKIQNSDWDHHQFIENCVAKLSTKQLVKNKTFDFEVK